MENLRDKFFFFKIKKANRIGWGYAFLLDIKNKNKKEVAC